MADIQDPALETRDKVFEIKETDLTALAPQSGFKLVKIEGQDAESVTETIRRLANMGVFLDTLLTLNADKEEDRWLINNVIGKLKSFKR